MKVLGGEIVFEDMRSEIGRFGEGRGRWMVVSSRDIGEESTWIWRVQILGGEEVSFNVWVRVTHGETGVVPRCWACARIYTFTAWIWWVKILRGEAVSVCFYFYRMLCSFMFGRVVYNLESLGKEVLFGLARIWRV